MPVSTRGGGDSPRELASGGKASRRRPRAAPGEEQVFAPQSHLRLARSARARGLSGETPLKLVLPRLRSHSMS
eukprot:4247321-Alexandrium_andersonii.AAC.1